MNKDLKKRIITSLFLLVLLSLMFFYTFILIISLVFIAVFSWIEFYSLISKILKKDDNLNKILRLFYKAISLIYLTILIYFIIMACAINSQHKIFIIYPILISIMSDVGGLVVGRLIKGKKLTKISPKKTISGSVGSFIFSLFLIPFFFSYLPQIDLFLLVPISLFISLTSQLGDLFISLLKRMAKVKDTSDLLPGHGGVLDRIDGMIFSIPIGFLILNYL